MKNLTTIADATMTLLAGASGEAATYGVVDGIRNNANYSPDLWMVLGYTALAGLTMAAVFGKMTYDLINTREKIK